MVVRWEPMTKAPKRFPASVYEVGDEPDSRFSLANERTFLAWIRTSLALLAGGVALEALELDIEPWLRLVAAVLLILAGIATPIQAWIGWSRTEQAMRCNTPLPAPALSLPIVITVIIVGILILVGLLVG